MRHNENVIDYASPPLLRLTLWNDPRRGREFLAVVFVCMLIGLAQVMTFCFLLLFLLWA